ncbi:uncharacterized protein I303_106954 [Kwoniella dejecticola CBS 10117]|uniref:Amino acid transporter transmembrane domain-containing protein n=1 Tax=Kwoniella dejecticola CBS 10117 TaxID=1296121 RepID=A0AAJ8KT94_9TREE
MTGSANVENIELKETEAKGSAMEPETNIYSADEANVEGKIIQTDEVFGVVHEDGPNYRNVGWLGTSVLMMKAQIGLGVLAIPSVLHTLGLIPGLICLLSVSAIITYGDYIVGTFKTNHPDVYGIDDVGRMLFGGRIGREFIAVSFWLFMTCVAGSGLLSISIGLNAISSHGTCTAVFVAVATVVTFCLASIQTLGKISWLGWVGMTSIMAALLTLAIAVGVEDRPAAAPQVGPWDKDLVLFGNPNFTDAIAAISTLVLSFAGTPGFFPIVSEMRNPRLYNRAMLTCQATITIIYTTIGLVVYCYCGQYVASPALGSAGGLLKKVCYGLALPALFVTAMLYTHLPAKYLMVRFLRGSEHLSTNTPKHYVVWFTSVGICVLFSYVIASAIPVFSGLVGLIGALLGTLLCIQLMGGMWLYDNWMYRHTDKSWKYRSMLTWNIFMIILGTFLMVAGTYGSVVGIKESYTADGGTSAWSCADNSK